ncbi:MAG: phosphatase [Firmicutes bacterium]|nr:phosphatase [Bacillota bacterium]
MKSELLIDTHCHTIASGHAYSTVLEIAKEANNKGLEMVAITDHGPKMPGGPHIFHIANQRVIPNKISGVEILRGVEANIMDYEGNLDVSEYVLKRLDIIIASLHDICIKPGTKKENTKALKLAMENEYVDIIAHPGNPQFPIDIEEVVLKAKETNTLIEINNGSFHGSRKGSLDNCTEIARTCKKHGVKVTVGSDSHISYDVGEFSDVVNIFKEIQMPEELIMNLSADKLKNYLKEKNKERFIKIDQSTV